MGERKIDILDAACRVIARRGVRGLRVEEIAREAGVSVALIYYHYQGREELLRRVLEYAHDRSRAYNRRDLPSGLDAPPRQQVERALLGEIQDDPAVVENSAVWGEVTASAIFDPNLRDAVRAGNDHWADAIEHLVRRGQADGTIPPSVDPRAAAVRLTAVTDGLSTRWLAGLLPTAAAHALLRGAVAAELGPPPAGEEGAEA